MGFLASIFRAEVGPANPPPNADFWYTDPGLLTFSNQRVSADTAQRVAAVFACVRVVAETIASLPLIIYRRLPDGGKERATDHPLYRVLHDRPNDLQTAFEFLEMMQGHIELRGNAYAQIAQGERDAIGQLVPIHPDRIQVQRIQETGRLRYVVRRWQDNQQQTFTQDEIFHLRGLSSDGITGLSPIAVARESVAIAMAAQEYGARFFANDSKPSGVLEHPGSMSEQSIERLKRTWTEAQTGGNRHKVAVLEEGMKYTAIGLSNRDSQFLESRQFQRSEIASIFRVPLHKIGDLTKATFSNIEQQSIEFVTDSIRPRLVRWERRINSDLLDPLGVGKPGEYFAEFLMDALLRGDLKSRYAAYATARQWGWMSVNDIRSAENMNPVEDGDEYIRPMNMTPAGQAGPDPADNQPEDDTAEGA